MTTYISILRGINVGGQKLIKMDALRKLYENLDFQNVKSYVQSGNVIFSAEEFELCDLEEKISKQIEKTFGFIVPVIVLTIIKLKQIIDNNPFLKQHDKELSFLHVTFLASKPDIYDAQKIEEKQKLGEEIFFSDDALYLYCPDGYGNTNLTNNFLEKKLKVRATTRNWNTTNELLKIAQEINEKS